MQLYPLLHIFFTLCYNPYGTNGEITDGISRMKKNEPPSVWGSLALLGQLGLVIVIPLVLGFFVGNYLDGLTNTKNVYLYLGLLLGLIVGIFGAYRLFTPYFKK
ncbi:MAG: AtpZ/AtpI family protein [Chloroflexi bacterium]|jgi:ATP synthase protein I|nr:MAG: AtpZ/AtpI family protein [Chloroflexota bacterium]